MKIYKLIVNEIASEPTFAVVSSYISPRTTKKVLYFASQEKAKEQQNKMYEAATELLGFMPKVEFLVEEIEVIE